MVGTARWRQRRPKLLAFAPFHGRLLAFFPDESLFPGREFGLRCRKRRNAGVFTDDNVPPWDTWVAYLQQDRQANYLVSWVPGPLVRMVDSGVHVIPEECVGWVDERCPQLIEALVVRALYSKIDKMIGKPARSGLDPSCTGSAIRAVWLSQNITAIII
jgi:hypothetical protein